MKVPPTNHPWTVCLTISAVLFVGVGFTLKSERLAKETTDSRGLAEVLTSGWPRDSGEVGESQFTGVGVAKGSNQQIGKDQKKSVASIYSKLPMRFEPNVGQFGSDIRYAARGANYGLFVSANGPFLQLSKPVRKNGDKTHSHKPQSSLLGIAFKGTNTRSELYGEEEMQSKSFYFIGNDPSKWHSNVPHYAKIHQKEIYPGVDIVYYGVNGSLEYDFELRPWASANNIQFEVNGAKHLATNESGDLVISTGNGTIKQQRPLIYQPVNGRKSLIDASY